MTPREEEGINVDITNEFLPQSVHRVGNLCEGSQIAVGKGPHDSCRKPTYPISYVETCYQ